ncbi:response regulator [Halobacteriovorax sp. GB3]|uniref:response regulator n=1 Tax=Halobacteriovorax sp. GB3 TaxID=2719615 RepID=UPI00235F93C6|nr:response regulator [Halobacteriovorax sp. GB3]MDD0852910.1 response regulator [Halobacteriovorax sp. GB3]
MEKHLIVIGHSNEDCVAIGKEFDGYECHFYKASTIEDVFSFIHSKVIDMIICDYNCAYEFHFDLARLLHEKSYDIPVVFYNAKKLYENHGTFSIEGKPICQFSDVSNVISKAFVNNLKAHEKLINPTIIYADDSDDNHLLMEVTLKDLGPNIVHSFTGKDALEDYKELLGQGSPIDIIILDLDMGELNGLETCRAMREYEKDNGLSPRPIVALSGVEKERFYHMCGPQDGFDAYIYKPHMREEILSTIKDWA